MTEYKTYITFKTGHMQVTENTTKENLPSTIQRPLKGPGARIGMIAEVKIIETSSDCIVFLAKNNQVLYPPQDKIND